MHHATQAISKPQTKSNEAAQREIEEAMCRVKEAQNLISAAIDPVIGLLSKDKRRLLFHSTPYNMVKINMSIYDKFNTSLHTELFLSVTLL